ncbi:hypothetical protein PAECIP111891_03408 [Paenibacillus allorhizoplanae]|uniref:Xylose isomerase-like TIM barrel domain-containing protein n=1 Tax=Paenibacillus allorhizoplanae TaxID=2905648 RepID=A0ABN8GLX6_9BACL|nr:TIM barrel protein [Paenibacillus allorhizoplanae]CAH1209789.1 hypothetical protein PAECIP111891_03408 [Paenibacillus allorhizoplanae]
MEIKLFKALWGMEGSLESQFERIAAAGYVGIEAPMPTLAEEEQFRKLLEKHQLDYIAMVFTQGPDHVTSFAEQVARAVTFQPISITSHSAKDSMPFEEQVEFFRKAADIEKEYGIAIGHETHRGRALYNPWETGRLLDAVPEINLTADYSHWCCVTETTLENQEENLRKSFSRVQHIHGRVGYAQGPQVPDPRAPEYVHELQRHMSWWDSIVQAKQDAGLTTVTFTPEFGPPGYLHTLPFTNQPVADLWDVCLWMGKHFKGHYKSI